jgi:sirohydrochlorin cobaltochelatase
MSERRGILLCGHGSRDATAVAQFAHVAELLRKRLSEYHVEYGYLEFARPNLHEALDALHAHSVHQMLAIPAMLMAAAHVKNDIPSVLNTRGTINPR